MNILRNGLKLLDINLKSKLLICSSTMKMQNNFNTSLKQQNNHSKMYYATFHGRNPKTPDLIYVPHVLRWLKTKFRLKYLQKTWDPNFSEGAFIYGTTKAVCRITEIIHNNTPEELDGLLTTSARIKLTEDMTNKITQTQKKIIQIKPEDIKILVPIRVNLKTEGITKQCHVSLRSLALKWFDDRGILRLVLVALQTEFSRDYTEGAKPEWTISIFDILECAMLSENPVAN